MTRIATFDKAIEAKAQGLKVEGLNATAFSAYRKSLEVGNDHIDFSEVIWDADIPAIIQVFRENGITEFTISSTFSSLICTLAKFAELGCELGGLAEVTAPYTDFRTGKPARVPAIRMLLK